MEYDEEKVEVSAGPSSRPATAEEIAEEKRLVRKLDYRIMPIACLLYLFACKSSNVLLQSVLLTVGGTRS